MNYGAIEPVGVGLPKQDCFNRSVGGDHQIDATCSEFEQAIAKNPGVPESSPALANSAGVMGVNQLYKHFATGLERGFYAGDVQRLWQTIEASADPASGITAGQVTSELLNVQFKIGVADALSKIATKLVEGLQSLVVKQG